MNQHTEHRDLAEFAHCLSVAEPHTCAGSPTKVSVQLAEMWQKLLSVGSVGSDDDYFNLGGDSILAVHLFAEIDRTFGVRLPVAVLFDAPTVDSLARRIEGELQSSGSSSLVVIQAKGERPPFFCIHGAGGNVLIYRDLSLHLGSDQPFYGLQSQGLDGSQPPLKTVEEMASRYVKEIRRAEPRGPYLLGGYCGGGTIAYEVAQQLRDAGGDVALLALFDTMNWAKVRPPSLAGKFYRQVQRFAFHAGNFFHLDARDQFRFVLGKARTMRSRAPVWWGLISGRFSRHFGASTHPSRVLGDIWRANDRACQAYVAKPFDGVITDIRPIKQYRMYSQPGLKWVALARRGQTVSVLPVYPAGMLTEPLVRHLAKALRESIDQAIREHEFHATARRA